MCTYLDDTEQDDQREYNYIPVSQVELNKANRFLLGCPLRMWVLKSIVQTGYTRLVWLIVRDCS